MTWISVSDRLPGDNEKVIICCIDDIGDYGFPYTYKDACEMGFYENGQWYSDNPDYIDDIDGVTHWMPLPEPPKTYEVSSETSADLASDTR